MAVPAIAVSFAFGAKWIFDYCRKVYEKWGRQIEVPFPRQLVLVFVGLFYLVVLNHEYNEKSLRSVQSSKQELIGARS